MGGGDVLAGAYNDAALTDTRFGYIGLWMPPDGIRPPVDYHGHSCCTYSSEPYKYVYIRHWIRTHPVQTLQLFGLHFINMWRPYTSEEGLPVREFPDRISSKLTWIMMNTLPIPIILLAFFGLFATWRQRRRHLLLPALLLLMDIAQCVIFYGSSRFRAPIEPILVLLTGGALWWLAYQAPKMLRLVSRVILD
jgi:hypothetical protein